MERCTIFPGQNKSSVPPDRKQSEKLPGFCADALVVSRENIQFLVVRLQSEERAWAVTEQVVEKHTDSVIPSGARNLSFLAFDT
jgi:hypothetical protein